MAQTHERWFETVVLDGKEVRHVSKFLRRDFLISVNLLRGEWSNWTSGERIEFAAAFAARGRLDANDQLVLDFLINNGDPAVWSTIALLLPRHSDRARALDFLLARVIDNVPPLANYYQALEVLPDPKSVPILRQAMARHDEYVRLHPILQTCNDRILYLDYVSCAAALFKVTRQERYRLKIKEISERDDQSLRQMAHLVAEGAEINLK